MKACRVGLRRRILPSSASTASTGDKIRASNARDSSATDAHTGSIVAIWLPPAAMIAVLRRRFKRLSVEPASRLPYGGGVADTAEVVIVGAGIMGVSTAYHLARLGVGPVVVLERDTVCSGSPALARGGPPPPDP